MAFVVVKDDYDGDGEVVNSIRKRIRSELGPIYVPEEIHIVKSLPKTRSGKIMRRVVKAVALNQLPGDISTLENSASVEEVKAAIDPFKKETS